MHFVPQILTLRILWSYNLLGDENMISLLSKSIALFLCRKAIIDNEKVSVCQYGFELIISTIIGFLLVAVSGIMLGKFLESMVFYVLFIVVRLFTGGYHANTHLKCKLTLLVCCLSVLLLSDKIEEMHLVWIHIFLLTSYLVSVVLFTPIEHVNATMTSELKKRNKKISVIMAIALTIINLAGYTYFFEISVVSTLTLFVIAILIIIPKIQERRKIVYEKSSRKST